MSTIETSARSLFTAAMCYRASEDNFSQMCRIWKDEVFSSAQGIPGLISMQLLTEKADQEHNKNLPPVRQAFAVGIWESVSDAQNYMKTGVFTRLLERLDGLLAAPPESRPWDAYCYYSRGF